MSLDQFLDELQAWVASGSLRFEFGTGAGGRQMVRRVVRRDRKRPQCPIEALCAKKYPKFKSPSTIGYADYLGLSPHVRGVIIRAADELGHPRSSVRYRLLTVCNLV